MTLTNKKKNGITRDAQTIKNQAEITKKKKKKKNINSHKI